MYKKSAIFLIALIIVNFSSALFCYNVFSTHSFSGFPFDPKDEEIINALKFVSDKQSMDGGIGGLSVSAWAAMSIFCAKENLYEWENLIEYLRDKSNLLDPIKATDWERQCLAIVACNENPRDFGGINYVNKINNFFDGNQIGSVDILYDDCFGIMALISAGVEQDETIIQNTKANIITNQNLNGGWGDGDSTAAAIMALISAGEDKESSIIVKAISFLKTLQTNDGGFRSFQTTNSASTAWIIMAISATGGNPTTEYWKKNGNDPVDYLLSLQNDNGSFRYDKNNTINPEWMTCYAVTAMLGRYYPVKILDKNIFNRAPETPIIISSLSFGNTGISYKFFLKSNDPDSDKIQYRYDWDASGNHDYSKWTKLVESGYTESISHKWEKSGIYKIKAQARDQYGKTSDWSEEVNVQIFDEIQSWTGHIRIEGANNTISDTKATVSDFYFKATNIKNGLLEEHYISYPSILGAIDAASKVFGFSYEFIYYPDNNSFSIKSIDDNSCFWHVFIDGKKIVNNYAMYKLTAVDDKILLGCSENPDAHALDIIVFLNEINNDKIIKVNVFDDENIPVKNVFIYVNSNLYKTNEMGFINISVCKGSKYVVYAEKNGYIRSEKEVLIITSDISILKPACNTLYFKNNKIINDLKFIWVFGSIDILGETSDDVVRVEYFIDNELVFIDKEFPFEYMLNQKSFFDKKTITVKSYVNKNVSDEIKATIERLINLLSLYRISSVSDFLKNLFDGINLEFVVEGNKVCLDVIITNLFPNLN